MSGPQLDDGYIRIANELYDAILQFPFTKRELLILLAVIRKTYGFNKKTDEISNYQLSRMTKISMQHVSSTVNKLAEIQVITVNELLTVNRGQPVRIIGINKEYTNWLTVNKTGTVNETDSKQTVDGDSQQNGNLTVNKTGTTKDNIKNNKKTGGRFQKPLLADVVEYCTQRKNNVDPQRFMDFYESNGWKVGKNSMKSWQAAVRTWESRQGNVTRLETTGPRSKPLAH